MFENMIDIMFKDEYDTYVFDTAPTANARRLLGMSSVYGLWVNKMMDSRKEAQSLRIKLSYSKKAQEEKDPLMDYLINFQKRMLNAKELLTDPSKTAFFFVTLPEALPIAVIRRFINWFHEFGIPVGGVVVNMVIDKSSVSEQADEFVLNRIAMQDEYMVEINDLFGDMVRGVVPLFETEVRGVNMLKRTADILFEGGNHR
jgi:arsenite-transporting ATPase